MTPPKHLDKQLIPTWKQVVCCLEAAGTCADSDVALIEALVVNLYRAQQADSTLLETGLTVTMVSNSGNEYYQQHPAVAISQNCWKAVAQFSKALGLTPESRVKLSSASGIDADEALSRLLE
jgi:P27 family predicted phage terminase small subunit